MNNYVFAVVLFGALSLASCQAPWFDGEDELKKELCPNFETLKPELVQKGAECSKTFGTLSSRSEVQNFCSHIDKLNGCFEGVVKVLERCSGKGVSQAIRDVYKLIDASADFACKNNGQRLKSLMNKNDTLLCLGMVGKNWEATESCRKLMQFDHYAQDSTLKTCMYLSDAESCYSDASKHCPNAEVRDFFRDAIKMSLDALDCHGGSSAWTLSASPLFVASGLLMLQLFAFI